MNLQNQSLIAGGKAVRLLSSGHCAPLACHMCVSETVTIPAGDSSHLPHRGEK